MAISRSKFCVLSVITGVQPSLENQKLPVKPHRTTADFGQNKFAAILSVPGGMNTEKTRRDLSV
jgi:hypothetical protein